MNIVKLSTTLHYCIRSPHLPYFKTKVECICIPKNHVNCIDFQLLNVQTFNFGMKGPFDESISCFLIGVHPWVLEPIAFRGLHALTFREL